eukprot:30612-Pelagococcus_subviridis.AAC.14
MSYEIATRAPSTFTVHSPSPSTIPHPFGNSQYANLMSFMTVRIPSMDTVDPNPVCVSFAPVALSTFNPSSATANSENCKLSTW